jgi:hypothetical protein
MTRVANSSRRDLSFNVGAKAWLSTAHLPLRVGTRKLAAKWAGPFSITSVVGTNAYRLALPPSWRIHDVFHVSQLKGVTGNPPRAEPIEIDQGEPEYEVQEIMGWRDVGGRRQFLVRWLGYSAYEDSWEDEANLANCARTL